MKAAVFIPLALVTLLLAGLLGYAWKHATMAPQATPPITFNQPFSFAGSNGATVTNATLAGKPTLYFYGFTHCPDVCPTTLATLTALLNRLGPDAAKLNVLFITVDPARDTPQVMAEYLKSFHPSILGLSGTPEQLAALTREMMVYYAKVPLPGGGYTMDHSAMVIMADGKGVFRGTISHEDSEDAAFTKLKKLIGTP